MFDKCFSNHVLWNPRVPQWVPMDSIDKFLYWQIFHKMKCLKADSVPHISFELEL